MKNRLLQLIILGAKALILLKRGLFFLFGGFLGTGLEKAGYTLAHWTIFPVFRLVDRARRAYTKRFGSLNATIIELAGHPRTLIVVFSVCVAFFLGAETRAFGSAEYLSGRHNLFFAYMGPGEEGLGIEEEGIVEPGIYTIGEREPQAGISVPVGLPGASVEESAPMDFIDYTDEGIISRAYPAGGAVLSGPRDTIFEYVIQPGNTLGGIAARFNISLQTLIWENNLTARSVLQVGQRLRILPVSGVSHKVKKGDTLARIAKLYAVQPAAILEFNKIGSERLSVGSSLIVPGGKKTFVSAPPSSGLAASGSARGRYVGGTPPPSLANTGRGMVWPTTTRRITQYFGFRHPGLDIAGPAGTPIYASDDGRVIFSGWSRGGYGYMVLVDHGNGLATRYAHNSRLYVEAGENVSKGQTIAIIGSTGRSTGPHLHFEVVAGGVRVNPFLYVR